MSILWFLGVKKTEYLMDLGTSTNALGSWSRCHSGTVFMWELIWFFQEGVSVGVACRRLVKEAVRERKCKDNCTAVLILFKHVLSAWLSPGVCHEYIFFLSGFESPGELYAIHL